MFTTLYLRLIIGHNVLLS